MPDWKPEDSFPYLCLSRQLEVPYAKVLAYVALMESIRGAGLGGVTMAIDLLHEPRAAKIMAAWHCEKARRRKVAAE